MFKIPRQTKISVVSARAMPRRHRNELLCLYAHMIDIVRPHTQIHINFELLDFSQVLHQQLNIKPRRRKYKHSEGGNRKMFLKQGPDLTELRQIYNQGNVRS